MKTEFVDVSETRKDLRVEIPTNIVNAEIDRVAKGYSRRAKVPGFRPGKTPARIIKQRFKDQILHDVAHDLIPRTVDDVLREKGLEAVDTPDVREVTIEEGQPLTFTASFDTLPPFEPGDYQSLSLTRTARRIEEANVDQALEQIRQRAARFEPVEGRGIVDGDSAVLDMERRDAQGESDSHAGVTVDVGGPANPPGFDAQLLGLEPGATKTFDIHYPPDYNVKEMADTTVGYTVTIQSIKKRVVPELDSEFAKDVGDFENLDALKARVRADLEHEAQHQGEHEIRAALMKQLASRLPYPVPTSLVDREIDRRLEEFVRQLMSQNVDPRQAGIDWQAFRESQREVAHEAVASALVLDAVGRHEAIEVSEAEANREIERYAERTGRTGAVVRAQLEKEGGLSRVYSGLRREKSIDFLLAHATISGDS